MQLLSKSRPTSSVDQLIVDAGALRMSFNVFTFIGASVPSEFTFLKRLYPHEQQLTWGYFHRL